MDNPVRALEYHQKALNRYQVLHDDDRVETAITLNNIGTAYRKLNNSKKALEFYKLFYKLC
jgi:tetratricopeptide (TPR) repeat protein